LSLFERGVTTEALRRKKKLKKFFKKWMHPFNFRVGSSLHPIGRGMLPKRDR